MQDTQHFKDMLAERGIQQSWVEHAIESPDKIENHEDGTRHFIARIQERGGRWLRVVVNIDETPNKRVTAFFDRRLRNIQ